MNKHTLCSIADHVLVIASLLLAVVTFLFILMHLNLDESVIVFFTDAVWF